MLFKNYHIPQIRNGEKTVTRREWDENYAGPTVGSVQMAAAQRMVPEEANHNSPMLLSDAECDCYIRITEKREEYLGEITEASARREGEYDGIADFREGYERVYGEGSWNDDKVVTVVEFEYVGRSRPGKEESEQQTLLTDGGRDESKAGTTRFVDGQKDKIEVDVDRLEEINELLVEAVEKAKISEDKPIRPSRAIALKRTEEAHHELSELLPGWHNAE